MFKDIMSVATEEDLCSGIKSNVENKTKKPLRGVQTTVLSITTYPVIGRGSEWSGQSLQKEKRYNRTVKDLKNFTSFPQSHQTSKQDKALKKHLKEVKISKE